MVYKVSMQEESLRRGPWLEEEDERLKAFVTLLGERRWDSLAKQSGLRRSGKSCRLRWLNYLHPNLKHGEINAEEELIIFQLHQQWGNKWAKIARRLPGRTDNEIKNYWRTHLRKKLPQTQQREGLEGEIKNINQDERAPIGDIVTQTRSNNSGSCAYEEKDVDISEISDDFSYANYELSNSLFGSSPYEAKVSDWMSCEQCEAKHYLTHSGEEFWDYFSSFSYPSWSYEEEICTSIVWDTPSSLWAMD